MIEIDIKHGDCKKVLNELEKESIDSCVTDPPYFMVPGGNQIDTKKLLTGKNNHDEGGFMGKKWDGAKVEVEESDQVPEELL